MEIERLLERHFNEGTSRKNVIDLEIQRLINWSFDQPEEKLKIYNESIHPQQAFSGIEKGSDQENYLFTLKLMAKRVKEYIHELEYLKVVTSESQQNLPKISITYCTSSDRSFEVHISGVGFPPDTGTITKVMFPNFSPIGSIAFRQGKLSDIPINSHSLKLYLIEKFGDIPSFKAQYGLLWVPETIDQLEWLNIKTLQDFDKVIPSDFKEKYMKIRPPKRGTNLSRLITHILVIYKTEDYFNRAWQGRYYEFDSQDYLVFQEFNVNMNNFPEEIHFDCGN